MSTIIRALWYAGLDKQELEELLPEAREENGRCLTIYASMTVLIFAVCLLVSVLAGGKLVVNRPIYTVMIVVGAALYLCARLLLPRHPGLSTLLANLYILSLYGYSFTVSLLHADMQGVAAVAILLVMPCMFNYRPLYMIVITVLAQAVYCLLSAQMKLRAIALLDLWNCLFFGSIAVMLSVFQMRVKFRLLLQKRQNRRLSEADLLTGARNRNCFEKTRDRYMELCDRRLYCIYADANGLHELNDTRGHEEGDRMLRTVAAELIRCFGADNTYRIGGDEFVAFCRDREVEDVRSDIRSIAGAVDAAGYSVSLGAACQDKPALELHSLVREAESYMYQEKQRYYEQSEHDRRKRPLKA